MPCARHPSCPQPGRCTPSCAPAAGLVSSRRLRRRPRAFRLRATLPRRLPILSACALLVDARHHLINEEIHIQDLAAAQGVDEAEGCQIFEIDPAAKCSVTSEKITRVDRPC